MDRIEYGCDTSAYFHTVDHLKCNFKPQKSNFQLDDIEDRLWSIVRKLNISPKTEFFYMRKEKMGNSFEVQQFYRIGMARPMIVENFGRITNDVFIDYRDTPITSRRRSNLCGFEVECVHGHYR